VPVAGAGHGRMVSGAAIRQGPDANPRAVGEHNWVLPAWTPLRLQGRRIGVR
jgi:hypothetical protein